MWTMQRDLAEVTEGARPDGVTIRTFETGRDERTFWEVAETSFEGHYGHVPSPFESWEAEWYQAHDWNPDGVLLAEREGAVVGELAWVEAGADGYIASVGVLEEHRGRGIATALLRAAFADIAEAGHVERDPGRRHRERDRRRRPLSVGRDGTGARVAHLRADPTVTLPDGYRARAGRSGRGSRVASWSCCAPATSTTSA